MNFPSKLQIKRPAFAKALLLAVGLTGILANPAKAQLKTQVIWDKWEASNTFWGTANSYNTYYKSAPLLQDITFGLKGTDEVRATSVSLITSGSYAGYLQVNVYTAFLSRQNGADSNWPLLGDLFLSTTGWNPVKSSDGHYTTDSYGKGTRWDVALDTPDIGYKDEKYTGTKTYEKKIVGGVHEDTATSKMTYDFDTNKTSGRLNQEVSWKSGGKTLGDYVFEARHATAAEKSAYDLYSGLTERDWSVYTYIFDPKMLGLKDGQQVGLRWQATCGNDIVEGSFEYDIPETPEPSTYALFGIFGIALVVAHRKWRGSRKVA